MGSMSKVKFVLMYDSIADTAFWVIPSLANIMQRNGEHIIEIPETCEAYQEYRSMAGSPPVLMFSEN